MYQYRLINCDKCTALILDVNNKMGKRGYGNSLYFSLTFPVILKNALKVRSVNLKQI